MGFRIVRNDIVKMNTEAIVNTANQYVDVGPGCDSAIYLAAGYDKLLKYRREHVGEVPEGGAFVTPGFNLRSKYIIHAVSPLYVNGVDGENDERSNCETLRACYRNALRLAKEYGVRSIAFPLISTGSYGYPKEEGIRIAVDEIYDFLIDNEMDVYLVVFDSTSTMLGKRIDPELESFIDANFEGSDYQDESFEADCCRSVLRTDENSTDLTPVGGSVTDGVNCESAAPMMNFETCMSSDVEANFADDDVDFSVTEEEFADDLIDFAIADVNLADVDNVELLEEKLNERVKHRADTFSEYLIYLIESKGLSNVEVYKKSIVDKTTFSKIKNDINYHPQKITALCLCIGARLNLDEARDLLARAGYALSPCDMTDIIFAFFIENKIYDIMELDIQLEEHGEPCIIQ